MVPALPQQGRLRGVRERPVRRAGRGQRHAFRRRGVRPVGRRHRRRRGEVRAVVRGDGPQAPRVEDPEDRARERRGRGSRGGALGDARRDAERVHARDDADAKATRGVVRERRTRDGDDADTRPRGARGRARGTPGPRARAPARLRRARVGARRQRYDVRDGPSDVRGGPSPRVGADAVLGTPAARGRRRRGKGVRVPGVPRGRGHVRGGGVRRGPSVRASAVRAVHGRARRPRAAAAAATPEVFQVPDVPRARPLGRDQLRQRGGVEGAIRAVARRGRERERRRHGRAARDVARAARRRGVESRARVMGHESRSRRAASTLAVGRREARRGRGRARARVLGVGGRAARRRRGVARERRGRRAPGWGREKAARRDRAVQSRPGAFRVVRVAAASRASDAVATRRERVEPHRGAARHPARARPRPGRGGAGDETRR